MVGRLLLWLVLGFAAWWVLRPRRPVVPPPPGAARAPAVPVLEAMLDCAECGLHFPASEAVRDGQRVYCCAAHRDVGAARGAAHVA